MLRATPIDGKKLVALRESKFLSRNELARRADLAISAIQRVEQEGIVTVRLGTMRKLATGLGVEVDQLADAVRPSNGQPVADLPSAIAPGSSAQPLPDIPNFDINVSAGPWTSVELCELNYDDPVARAIVDHGRFRLRIHGDSMTPTFPDKSIVEFVILRAYDAPTIGAAYAVCRSDSTGTFKALRAITNDELVLEAINKRRYRGEIRVPRQEVTRIARAVGVFVPVEELKAKQKER